MRRKSAPCEFCLTLILFGLVIVLIGFPNGYAQENTPGKSAETLKGIVDAADRFCVSVPLENIKKDGGAEVRAQAENIFTKYLGLNASGSAHAAETIEKGLRANDFLESVKDERSCRIAIFNKLAEIMLASNKDDSSPLLPWLVPAKISSTSVANSDQFCIKIKAVISSARKNFLGDIIKSNLGKGHKVILPNSNWCAVNEMPQGDRSIFIYYSCSLMRDETSADAAYSKYASYQKLLSSCLGSDWISSVTDRKIFKDASREGGAETKIRKNFDDPSITLRTRDMKDGIDMYIDISPPYSRF
jgi:hypothetical protein